MNYLTTADDLAQMVADGTFPAAARTSARRPARPGSATG